MKKLAILLFTVICFSQGYAINNSNNPKKELRNEIITFLNQSNIEVESEPIEADIVFTLNTRKEIVILTVDTKKNDHDIERYVKSKLNYKKVISDISTESPEIFKMKLKIVKPNTF